MTHMGGPAAIRRGNASDEGLNAEACPDLPAEDISRMIRLGTP